MEYIYKAVQWGFSQEEENMQTRAVLCGWIALYIYLDFLQIEINVTKPRLEGKTV